MLFNEIGSTLKHKRELRGIESQDVAKALKIPHTSILAIENGDITQLPHEVYIRTFIKGYASFLGYTAEEIKETFHDIEDFEAISQPPKSLEAKRAKSQPESTKSRGRYLIVQLLVVGLIGVSGYFLLTQSDTSAPIENENIVEASSQGNEKMNSENIDVAISSVTPKNAVPKTNTPKDINATTLQNMASIPRVVPDLVTPTPEAVSPPKIIHGNVDWSKVPMAKPGQNQVVMYANEDCWMQVTRDGKILHFILAAGKQRDFTFDQTIQFKIANANAITMYYNNNPVDVGDSSKTQVINLPLEVL